MHLVLLLLSQAPGAEIDAQIAELQARVAALEAVQPALLADDYVPDGGDLADALDAIQALPECGPLPDDAIQRQSVGCRVRLGRGVYPMTRTATLCRGLMIEGVSGWGPNAATKIEVSGHTAFRVGAPDLCESVGYPPEVGGRRASGQYARLSDLAIVDTASVGAPVYSAAIHMEARAAVDRVFISGFTQGVRISADVLRTETSTEAFGAGSNTNANLARLTDVTVYSSRHAGVFLDGGDANAGYLLGVDSSGNCLAAEAFSDLGPCANVVDSSFLGNTHLASHSAVATSTSGQEYFLYLSDNVNSRNVWVGTYGESGHASSASRRDLVLGGIGTWGGEGMIVQDDEISGFCSRVGDAEACMGARAGTGLIAFQRDGENNALRLKPSTVSGVDVWLWDIANLGVGRAWMVVRNATAGLGLGDVLIERRLVIPQCAAPDPLELAGLGLEAAGDRLGVCEVP